jgi:hypothetical protein
MESVTRLDWKQISTKRLLIFMFFVPKVGHCLFRAATRGLLTVTPCSTPVGPVK